VSDSLQCKTPENGLPDHWIAGITGFLHCCHWRNTTRALLAANYVDNWKAVRKRFMIKKGERMALLAGFCAV